MKNLKSKFSLFAHFALMMCLCAIGISDINAQGQPDPGAEHCRCTQSIVQNGNFSDGSNAGGNIPTNAYVTGWNKGTNTPKYFPGMGFDSPGYIYLWGNQTVSESIWQKVYFQKGKKYKGCFAFKYIVTDNHKVLPSKHIRFKLLASKTNQLATPQCPDGTCTLITMSQTIVAADGWQVHFFEDWVPDDDYNFLYITPENDEIQNGANYISHGYFDDLCIEEDNYLDCDELAEYAGFNLTSSSTEGNLITSLVFEPTATLPYGVSHWWQIYEAENCNESDFTILGEYTAEGDNPLRGDNGQDIYQVTSPDGNFDNLELNKCYIIKHGLYYWDGNGCNWVERRGKLKVSFGTNQRSKDIQFIPQGR